MKIKRFTETGNEEFEIKIEELCDAIKKKNKFESRKIQKLMDSIHQLAKNAARHEGVEGGGDIETKNFTDRHELGVYLCEKLHNCDLKKINNDINLWNWLTAFYIKNVFSGRATEIVRFVYKKNFFRGKRHLIRTPWVLMVHNPTQVESLKFCLSTPTHQGSNMCEQFISRMDLWKNPNIVQLCYDLYYDPVAGRQKKGADNHRKQENEEGKKYTEKGVLYPRLYKNILILSKNKDVWDLDPSEIRSEIKEEFDIWDEKSARTSKDTKLKNPPWTRNELSICLWYYHNNDKDELLKTVSNIHLDISKTIKKINDYKDQNLNDNFRNPTGVWRKLRNFASLDPSISNDKFKDEHYGKLDREVFLRYPDKNNLENLNTVVKIINQKNNLNLNV